MKTLAALCLVLLVAGCANRQPTVSSEVRVQSQRAANALAIPAAPGAPAAPGPFCLHIRYSNQFNYVLTENSAQAWVTDGFCEAEGARRAVSELVVRWRYRNDKPGNKVCAAADTCALNDQNYGEGKQLVCVSASARDGGQEAAASTDWYACAR